METKMEMQEMQEVPQDKENQYEEAGAQATMTGPAEEGARYIYSKLKNPSEDIYQDPFPNKPRPGQKWDERYPRSAHVYHAACAVLGLICLVLLLVVIILGVKLSAQPEACSQERRVEEKAQRCSFESCKAQFPALPQTPTCQKCAKGWLTFSKSCYYLSKFKESWEDSRSFCKTNGADLADITNQQVQTFLTGKGLTMYWIGLRQSGGSWSWVNNTTLGDSYWAEDGLDGDCGALHVESPPKKNWSKRPCSHLSYFICQKQP